MRRELEQKLVERWPSWFKVNGSTFETRMVDGFVHGDGWFAIAWRLCEDLEPLVGEGFEVKEKFGELCFYVRAGWRTEVIESPSKPLNWKPFALAKCAVSRGRRGKATGRRCAMSTPAYEPVCYPHGISVNFAEAQPNGRSRMKEKNGCPAFSYPKTGDVK